MATVTTLDEKIREKARNDLKDRIHAAFSQGLREMSMGYQVMIAIDGKQVSAFTTIEIIENKIFEMKVVEAERKAIDEFVRKVETLQDQVAELANQVSQS